MHSLDQQSHVSSFRYWLENLDLAKSANLFKIKVSQIIWVFEYKHMLQVIKSYTGILYQQLYTPE